ncbi:MAG: class I SAM-dependent methyltransferase [Planctomycetes bacterium]|nr:class I SAM-dependent methyltransferase [Planctomycetota bacterium]
MDRQGRWPQKREGPAETDRLDLSRSVFRSLVASLKINIGSRVLDAGCGSGQLTQRLHAFGADVLGLDESAKTIRDASQAFPHVAFQVGQFPPIPLGHPDAEFEVIIVQGLSPYADNLFGRAAFQMTADLLCSLRPNGRFAFLNAIAPGHGREQDPPSHSIACYARHLSFFPGVCRVCHLPNGPTTGVVLSKILGQRSPAIWRLAVLKIPSERLSAEMWRQLAEQATAVSPKQCCDQRDSAAGSSDSPRAA